jgi:hypothetical protein
MTKKESTFTGKKKLENSKEKKELTLVSDLAKIARENGIKFIEYHGIKIEMDSQFRFPVQSNTNQEPKKTEENPFTLLQNKLNLIEAGVNHEAGI